VGVLVPTTHLEHTMAPKMKIFTTGLYGSVNPEVGELLGLPQFKLQARVLVAAATKRDAHKMLAARDMSLAFSAPEFRLAMGNDVDALSAASLLLAPTVLALASDGESPVVRIEPDRNHVVVGRYRPGMAGGSFVYATPVPADQVPADQPSTTTTVASGPSPDKAKPLRVFTLGNQGRVPRPLALALGISAASNHCQAQILVAASSKAVAHMMLTARGLHISLGSAEFRQAYGRDVTCLTDAGLLATPTVLALPHRPGPVARIDTDGYQLIGTYTIDDTFVPDVPAGDGLDDEREDIAIGLVRSTDRINELENELVLERARRNRMCQRAIELKMVERGAAAMDVTVQRLYQLADKGRRELAAQGDFRPGLWVTVERVVEDRYPLAEVVPAPADAVAPLPGEPVVWVRYTNGCVVPQRPDDLRVFVPPCSMCPPAEQELLARAANPSAALRVHQVAKHGAS
jgi:hypothetical protein